MAERHTSLERRLELLAMEIDASPPDLAGAVRARLAEEPVPPAARPGRFRALAIAVAALLLAGGTAYAASSDVRDAVRDLLGIGAVEVERVPELEESSASGLGLGRPIDPSAAAEAAGFEPLRSADPTLSDPSAAFTRTVEGQPAISFVYPASDTLPSLPADPSFGAVLTEVEGLDEIILKQVLEDARIEEVRVGGSFGLWIGGDDHLVAFPADSATGIGPRASANALIWTRGPLTLRLEAEIPQEEAVRLAETVP